MKPQQDQRTVEKVGWAIVQALHANVPEDQRPMSWSDLSEEHENRILAAAHAAMVATIMAGYELEKTLAEAPEIANDH
jgi:hypothetical protein